MGLVERRESYLDRILRNVWAHTHWLPWFSNYVETEPDDWDVIQPYNGLPFGPGDPPRFAADGLGDWGDLEVAPASVRITPDGLIVFRGVIERTGTLPQHLQSGDEAIWVEVDPAFVNAAPSIPGEQGFGAGFFSTWSGGQAGGQCAAGYAEVSLQTDFIGADQHPFTYTSISFSWAATWAFPLFPLYGLNFPIEKG